MPAQIKIDPLIFRRSDIRGLYPQQLNLKIAKIIGAAVFKWLKGNSKKEITLAIGRDVRVSSGEIFTGFAEGFMAAGGNIIDLDLIGTEVISFAASTLDVDGAAIVSASHNPQEFNGIKLVKRGAVPVAYDSGLEEIRQIALSYKAKAIKTTKKGQISRVEILQKWTEFMRGFIDHTKIKPLVVMLDAGNGMAGMMLEYLLPSLPIKVTKLFFEPDGNFPNHVPNPMLPQNLTDVTTEVKRQHADFGIAFDGDADRAIFIDETGKAINCTVLGTLIAEEELKKNPGESIIYNAVCGRILPEAVSKSGGRPTRTMVGHSVVKEKMRALRSVFAAEHSGHFYYRDYFESDSSMLTMIKILEIISKTGLTLSELTRPLDVYPQSGELNFSTPQKEELIQNVRKSFINSAKSYDELDGISLWYGDWWFNLRPSQNEDLLRLNVEANSQEVLDAQTSKLTSLILNSGAKTYIPY